jgi:hypothetical protein
MAPTTKARVRCRQFNRGAITKYFGDKFLRLPSSPSDLKSISQLHLRVHGISRMFLLGSLDCIRTGRIARWLSSSRDLSREKRRANQSMIILEAVAGDHCLWFCWHASYG